MNQYELSQQHAEVSMELSNPFAKLGNGSMEKLKGFLQGAAKYTQSLIPRIDNTHPNGLFSRSDDIAASFKEKKVVYSDYQYLTIFVPTYLKDGASMAELGKVLEESMDLCVDINKSTPLEVKSLVDAYVCQPARLTDPMLIIHTQYEEFSLKSCMKRMEVQNKVWGKLTTSTGSSSEREFRKVYGRINDYYMANDLADRINRHYVVLSEEIVKHVQRVEDVNKSVNELIRLMETDPNYQVSAIVGKYISDTVYDLAMITSWYAATLFQSQMYLKAMQDTNLKIRRVLGQ